MAGASKICLTVTVDSKIYKEIENLRGNMKRSTFVNELLKNAINQLKEKKKK